MRIFVYKTLKVMRIEEYNAIVKRINELLEVVTDDNYDTLPQAIELDFLSDLVEEYERKYYPVKVPNRQIELIQCAV